VSLKKTVKEKREEPNPTAVQDWIKPQVAKYKWLSGGVAFVDEIPKTLSGKIMRKIIQEWAQRDAASFQIQRMESPKL
jgi:4-coumarate--CoA ligase